MKITLAMLFVAVFQLVATTSYSQVATLSMKANRMELTDFFSQIEKQTEFLFFYLDEDVKNHEVTIDVDNKHIDFILKEAFQDTALEYIINDRNINVFKKQAVSSQPQQQQKKIIKGVVVDSTGETIIGANVIEKGTTNGTITDIDGQFSLQVAENSTLYISYIGYNNEEIAVAGKTEIHVVLKDNLQLLDEIVVVGYGTQAKKDITGSVSVVNTEALQEQPVATFAEALQGRASGVYILGSGAPGAETTIRIRGVGSVNDGASDPLIVVDGMSNVDISSVNPNDIESLQILKDASATAIYGAQGANGVIIITTKQGSKDGRVRISYSGYVGMAKMANSGYDVLNAWEGMEFVAQGMVNLRDIRKATNIPTHAQFGSLNANDQLTMPYALKPSGLSRDQVINQFGSIEGWVKSYQSDGTNSWVRSAYHQMLEDGYSDEEARKGTDWYSQIVQTGFVQDHQISIMGGGEKGNYSASLGYSSREGTVKASYFDRYSARLNTSFIPSKYLSTGVNANLVITEMQGERSVQDDNTSFVRSLLVHSHVPLYTVGGDYAGAQAVQSGSGVSALQTVESQKGNWTRNFRGQLSAFAEIKPVIEGLSLRTQFSANLSGQWSRTFNLKTIAGNSEGRSQNSLTEASNYRFGWQWTNTATYTKKFNKDHTMTLLVGTEALALNYGRNLEGSRFDYVFENDENTWILNNGSSSGATNSGSMSSHTTQFGLFFRGDYNYKGKYLATMTVRRDADSRFGENNRWGTFPSVSLGWRISEENFFEPTRGWLDDLKLRAGYGTTGNSQIGAYNYAFQYATGDTYMYSRDGGDMGASLGYGISNLGDPDAKWETVKQLNVGLDATFFQKLTLGLDLYTRKTSDMLVNANWSAFAGRATRPKINIGDMENKGIDFSVGYQDKIGKFSYNVAANISTYKNKVVRLGSSDLFNDTRLSNVNITTVGKPTAQFYGFKVDGIYTSAEEVINYKTKEGATILPYLVTEGTGDRLGNLNPEEWVGRFKYRDVNGDGKIDADDRTFIGNPHPDFTGGLNIGLKYKDWDLSTYFYFSVGNDIFRQYMFYTHFGGLNSNYVKDRRDNSWHPVNNPKGIYPLWVTREGEGVEAITEANSIYVDDGSYLRMQTLSLGYSLPGSILKKTGLERVRLYGQVSNVFTITGYSGLDPEIRSSNELNKGIDYSSYGVPRQFIFGVNISF